MSPFEGARSLNMLVCIASSYGIILSENPTKLVKTKINLAAENSFYYSIQQFWMITDWLSRRRFSSKDLCSQE
jgi:hypothetical protein